MSVKKAIIWIVAVLIIAGIAAGAYFIGKNGFELSINKLPTTPVATQLVGNDTDEHGCIGSAGYTWCEEKQKCLRVWEESCSTASPSASTNASETDVLIAAVKAAIVAEHGTDAASLNYTVSKLEGDYAQGGVSGTGGGGMWFAAKVAGVWKLVYDGNGVITCTQVAPYPNFPTSMIPECWDTSTNNLVKR